MNEKMACRLPRGGREEAVTGGDFIESYYGKEEKYEAQPKIKVGDFFFLVLHEKACKRGRRFKRRMREILAEIFLFFEPQSISVIWSLKW